MSPSTSEIMRQWVAQAGEPALFTVPSPPWLVKQAPSGMVRTNAPGALDSTRPQPALELSKTQAVAPPRHNISHPVHQRGSCRRRKRRRPGGAAIVEVAAGSTRAEEAAAGLLESATRVSGTREQADAERHLGPPSRKEDRSNYKFGLSKRTI